MPYPMLKSGKRRRRPTANEQALARCLLMVVDKLDWEDPDQEDLYNTLKPLAEDTLRGDVSRETQTSNNEEFAWLREEEG